MKPKLLFVYDHKKPEYWMDGLWAALNLLEKDFVLQKYNIYEGPPKKPIDPHFILGWGAFGSKTDEFMQQVKTKKRGLCIAGNALPPVHADYYDVLFYETKWYRPQIQFHPNIVHAFGVNTDIFFRPDMALPSLYDYIGVGAFASWKRWEKMKNKPGNKLVIGEYQDGNEEESLGIVRDLVKGGVTVSNMVSPFDLSNLYLWSRKLYMPADINGGGERSILEARACGLEVEIEDDNSKLLEIKNWDPIPDHHWYAKQLKKGILSVL